MEKLKPSQLLVEKYLRGQEHKEGLLIKAQQNLSEVDRLQVLTKIQKLCEDDALFGHFQQLLKKDDENFQQSQKSGSFPRDFATEELFSVYERLYSLAKEKAKLGQVSLPKSQGSSLKQKQVCERLYKESKDRIVRNQAKQLAYETKIQAERTVQPLEKSNRLAYEKVARDIDRVLEYIDYETTGYFNAKQVGQCLQILKVFNQMFSEDGKKVNKILLQREELFLMHLWYMLNPIESTTIEVRILYTFLKLVFDPYQDGSIEQFDTLSSETKRLIQDIKKLQLELIPDAEDAISKIDSVISVDELLKELFALSCNCIDYKRGLVVLPNTNKRKLYQSQLDACTFKPTINALSIKIDQEQNRSITMAGKIVRRSEDGSFSYTLPKSDPHDLRRIDTMLEKANRTEQKLAHERLKRQEKELDGCTFKPKLVARLSSGDNRFNSIQSDMQYRVQAQKQNNRDSQQKTSWQIKEEIELEKCTFRPNTAKPNQKIPNSKQFEIVGYRENVDRMRLAEEERKLKNEILNGNIVAKKYTGQITVVQPFSFQRAKPVTAKSDVILDVEITVPPNKVASLKIRKGDCVSLTVGVFSKLWGLNQLTESAIEEKITQHLITNEMYKFTTEGHQQDQHREAMQPASQPLSTYMSCQDETEDQV